MPITEGALASVALNTGALITNGSPYATLAECNSAGSITGTKFQMPLIKTSGITDETATNTLTDEGGNTYTSDGARTISFNATIMQGDVHAVTFPQTARGKYFTIVKQETSEDVGGGTLYSIYPIAKLRPSVSKTNPGGELQYTFDIQNNTTAIGVNLATFADSIFRETLTGTTTVNANAGYKTILFT